MSDIGTQCKNTDNERIIRLNRFKLFISFLFIKLIHMLFVSFIYINWNKLLRKHIHDEWTCYCPFNTTCTCVYILLLIKAPIGIFYCLSLCDISAYVYFLILWDHGMHVVYNWKQISAPVLGGVNGVASFITIDGQLQ